MTINPLRGESKLVIATTEYVLEATMESLAQLSSSAGDPPVDEFYNKLMRASLGMQRLALGVFVQGGRTADGKTLKRRDAVAAAVRDIALSDIGAWSVAMIPLLDALTRKPSDDDSDSAGNQPAAPG